MASMVNFVLVGLLFYCIAVESNCPDGWLTHGTECYFFSHDTEDIAGTMTMCTVVGGQLAEIQTDLEARYLANQAKLYDGNYWIGLTDIQEEGQWQWLGSKTPIGNFSHSHWLRGQPDNQHHDQNCVYIEGTASGRWVDSQCHSANRYICEKDAVNPGEIVG